MCGIVGVYAEQVHPESLARATRTLHHRGPDGQGLWIAPSKKVGLGHTRLSIIDLAGGQQPLWNEDETIHAVVNGEIYDFERLRADLIARGHRFRTQSDSEVLIHLYEEHGTGFVEHIRGELAFILYDARADMLVAGRDRFGIKPLFYAEYGRGLVLASEAKALFGYGVPARFDAEIIADRGALGGGAAEDRTMFFGVRQVPPAHLLIATRGHLRTVRYWDFDFPPIGHERPGTDEEDIERLHQAVDEAVRLRLRADVPVACYLSGGLDSSAVLGYAASHYAGPIKAFTLSFDRPEYDEEPIARAMAQHVGADYFAIPVSQSDFAREFSDAVWHAERPLVNANGVAKFMLSRAVRDAGIKVVLTGEGADEIFAGYPHFRRDLIIQRGGSQHELTALADTNQVSRGMLMPDGEGLSTQAVRTALGFVPSWIEAMASAAKKLQPLRRAAPDQPAARDALPAFLSSIEISRQLRGRHPLHQSMYVWARSMLPNFILTVLGDRMEMAHSLEGRLPFLDHHVVELATRLHPDRLIRGGTEKWILRQIARPMITPKVYERQKHPFVAPPIVSSPEGALYIQMQDTLRSVAARSMPLFDARQLVALLDSLPKLDLQTLTALDTPLMAMFSSCILQQRFAVQEPSGSLYDADPATRPAG